MNEPDPGQRHWNGAFIPPQLWDMVSNGILSPAELLLLLEIHSLCSYASGVPCFAGDPHFAKRLHTNVRVTQHRLKKLKDLDLIWTVRRSGTRRYLTTRWFDSQMKEGGKQYKTPEGSAIRSKRTQPIRSKRTQPVRSKRTYSNKSTINKTSILPGDESPVQSNSSFFDDSPSGEMNGSPHSKFDRQAARKLFDALKEKGRLSPRAKASSWPKQFMRLRSDGASEEEITEVLDWYLEHMEDKYTPKAYLARTFREKFYPQLKPAMERHREDRPKINKWARKNFQAIKEEVPNSLDPQEVLYSIQRSRNEYKRFLDAVLAYSDDRDGVCRDFYGDLWDTSEFIPRWYLEGFDRGCSEKNLEFKIGSDRFRRWYKEQAEGYTAPPIKVFTKK